MRLLRIVPAFLAAALWVSPAGAQGVPGSPRYQPITVPLSDALAVIKEPMLVGVFMFVAPAEAPAALASYLIRNHAGLKRFVRRAEKDVAAFKAISRWDKLVFLHLVGMGIDGSRVGGKRLSKKWVARVQDLTLVPSRDYREIALRRGGR